MFSCHLLQRETTMTSCLLPCMYTLKCLRIGTPKAINFPFVSNGKLMVFRCPNSQAHFNEAVIYLNCGTPKYNEFSIWNKWKIYYFLVSQYLSTLGYVAFQTWVCSYRKEFIPLVRGKNLSLWYGWGMGGRQKFFPSRTSPH